MNPQQQETARTALTCLQNLGFACVKDGWREWEARVHAHEQRTPTPEDALWPLATAPTIEEHLANAERPFLSCAIAPGRAYRLTEWQRKVLWDWFHMTASPTVQVLEIALFDNQPVQLIRHVILRSEEHIDPQNKALLNGPRKVTIDRWGAFMSTALHLEREAATAQRVRSLAGRVERLLDRAKREKVHTDLRVPGDVAHEWHARIEQEEVETKTDVSPERQRDMLRDILCARGEGALACLVRDPKPRAVAEDGPIVVKTLDEIMKELETISV